MRINNISTNINFGKAIAVNKRGWLEDHHKQTLRACTWILNGKKPEKEVDFYTKEEKEEIKEFFKDVFEGDNEEIALNTFKGSSYEENYLVSGQEEKDIKTLWDFANQVYKMEIPQTENCKHYYGGEHRQSRPHSALNIFKAAILNFAIDKSNVICAENVSNQKDSISLRVVDVKNGTLIEKTKTYQDGKTETSSIRLRTYHA